MVKQKKIGGRLKAAYWSMVGVVSSALISLQPVMADTIWDRFSTIMRDVYGKIVGISTIVAVTVAAIGAGRPHGIAEPACGGRGDELAQANRDYMDRSELAGLHRCISAAIDCRRKLHRLKSRSSQMGGD